MLNELEEIAANLTMEFAYGSLQDLEDYAQDFPRYSNAGFLLFHEGYLEADLFRDGQGALEYKHRLVLDICMPSLLADAPVTRREHRDELDLQMRKVYKALTKYGQESGARIIVGLNKTSRNLDVIQLIITIQPNAVSLCS